jgi:hypothetical protein
LAEASRFGAVAVVHDRRFRRRLAVVADAVGSAAVKITV